MSALANNIRIIEESGLFDKKWYSSIYPDVRLLKMDEVEHYLRVGATLGRDPGPGFQSAYYLATNPDVLKHGMNPLLHYIRYGRKEGRRPSPPSEAPSPDKADGVGNVAPGLDTGGRVHVDMHGTAVTLRPAPTFATFPYTGDTLLDGPCVVLKHDRPVSSRLQMDIGIHLHVHYMELLPDVAHFLASIPTKFVLYVSASSDGTVAAAAELLGRMVPNARIDARLVPNVGRDIAAFVVEFGAELATHDLIAHIHTKRSPHNRAKADWRRQLCMNLMGTPGIVESTMALFEANPQLGMVFPEYHHALRGQISWGTNFEISQALAARIGIAVTREDMVLFPAGSMFWARPAALRPLWDCRIAYSDFPEESGQVDGTIAHAVERLFGAIVDAGGFQIVQSRSDKPPHLMFYYPRKWKYPVDRAERAMRAVSGYSTSRSAGGKRESRVVVFTALAGGYENLLPHENLNPDYDYVAYCDVPADGCGFWDVRPMDYWNPDPVRMARYVKTHPHKYFPGYDYAIWVDANVVIRGDLAPYLAAVEACEDAPIGGIPHPVRQCIFSEADAVLSAKKDDEAAVQEQIAGYRDAGFPVDAGLVETNFMVTRLGHPAARALMDAWWMEINSKSRRDQLSLNYVLWKKSIAWVPLMDERTSLRDHFDFAYFGHGRNSGYLDLTHAATVGAATVPAPAVAALALSPAASQRPAVDILVCVHNALDEVRECLQSVVGAIGPDDRVIIVDDASDHDTAEFLDGFVEETGAILIRNPAPARGYCAAANMAMRAVESSLFLLLNSDTVLVSAAFEKMIQVMLTSDVIGIVGPLSNAASTQSIPEIRGGPSQTAVNRLPAGMSVAELDQACSSWSAPGLFPSVPLVHGFCQLIRKQVIDRVGVFDEASFPHGYGEENDLCFRAADAGFDLKIATNSFVYHAKSASYSDSERRQALMKNGAEQLRRKHSARRVGMAVKTMENHPLLVAVRFKAAALYALPGAGS